MDETRLPRERSEPAEGGRGSGREASRGGQGPPGTQTHDAHRRLPRAERAREGGRGSGRASEPRGARPPWYPNPRRAPT